MIAIRETSTGPIAFSFTWLGHRGGGAQINVRRLDQDGWEIGEIGSWSESAEKDLGEVVAETASIPLDEAARIAEPLLGEWRERGGEDEMTRSDGIKSFSMLTAIFVPIALVAVAVVAALVVLLIVLL